MAYQNENSRQRDSVSVVSFKDLSMLRANPFSTLKCHSFSPVALEGDEDSSRRSDRDVDGDDLDGGAVMLADLEPKVLFALGKRKAARPVPEK